MTTHHDRLGIAPTATSAEIKAAYHAKLREFPAHSHPEEFKAIRTAYEALRKGETAATADFFETRPLEASIDLEAVRPLRERIMNQLAVNLEELIRETF